MAKVEKKAPNKYVILAPVVVIVALLIMFFLYSGSVANYKRTGFLNVRGDVTKDSEAIINLAWEKVEKAYGYEDG